jgi:lipid II:glycine glycyltransferase (peptidoglycan interpeptide bridge formation enzyme)
MNAEVVSCVDVWKSALNEIGRFDFVHTYDFHKLSSDNGEGEPLLFVVRASNGKVLACWPTLKCIIPGTNYVDLSCVYGYGGPIFAESIDVALVMSELYQSMVNFGAVSLFSRMHSLFIDDITDDVNRGEQLGDVVVIDVKRSGSHLMTYRGSHRREIVNAYKKGLEVVVDWDCAELDDFIDIYQNAMRDLNASDYYLFKKAYFEKIVAAVDFKVFIISASFEGVKIASSMFIVTNDLMQYYLSGSDYAYRNLNASKAIIAKAHELASELGVRKLILGGGVGSQKDSLFKFKAGFSKNFKPFYVVKKVLLPQVYLDLCEANQVSSDTFGFFPPYRK